MWEKYSRVVSLVQLHAQKIAGHSIPPTVFDLSAAAPDLQLPVVNFRRVNVGAEIPVPALVGSAYAFAKQRLTELGLEPEGAGNAVDANSTAPKDIVTAQAPTAGTMVAPKTRVRLVYNYVPSTRFP